MNNTNLENLLTFQKRNKRNNGNYTLNNFKMHAKGI